MFSRLESCAQDNSVLRGTRDDGRMQIIDDSTADQMLSRAQAGEFGKIHPYQAPKDEEPQADGSSSEPSAAENGATPASVAQIKLQLSRDGLLGAAELAIAANAEASIVWATGGTAWPDGLLAQILASVVGGTAAVAALFASAAAIRI